MAPASQPIAVAELRRWLERTEAHGCDGRASLFSGVTALDDHLPVGGLRARSFARGNGRRACK